jgi:hypothetical protein
MVDKIVTFRAKDGETFTSESAATAHEHKLDGKAEKNYQQFIGTSYSGRELLKKHSLNEYGIWEVRGEDPNCDLGGAHYQPKLGFFEGTLEQVIRKAVSIPGFYTWGGGGDIKKNNPPQVNKL